jgi:hypothetical protein
MYEVGALLENFLCKIVFRPQFVLLLFLRGLMSSILSFYYRAKFRWKETFSKKMELFLQHYSKPFVGEPFWGKEMFVEKSSCSYLF